MFTTPKKHWKESRAPRTINLSVSRVDDYDLCNRKWWFKEVRKLDTGPAKGATVIGTVVHAVIERYLAGDDLGRDPKTGQMIDLYPDGWWIAKSRWGDKEDGRIDTQEQVIVRKLIAAAIDQGILCRERDRHMEFSFEKMLLEKEPCPKCDGTGGVTLLNEIGNECYVQCDFCNGGRTFDFKIKGFIDEFTPTTVQDHKTLGKMRYAKSPKELARNVQALTYARVLVDWLFENSRPVPNTIELRHNQYCKDVEDLRVKKTSVEVTHSQIDDNWKELQDRARKMLRLRMKEAGFQIPDPPKDNQACNAYGGCPYVPICSGQESEAGYEKRLDNWKRNRTMNADAQGTNGLSPMAEKINSLNRSNSMSSLSALFAQQANAQAQTAQQLAQPQPQLQPAAQPQIQQPQYATGGLVSQPPQAQPTFIPQVQAAPQPTNPQPLQQPAQVQTAPTPAAQSHLAPPPWAQADCTGCKGLGFTSTMKPCRICASKCREKGQPSPCEVDGSPGGDYIVNVLADGTAVWQLKGNDEVFGQSWATRTPPSAVTTQQASAGVQPDPTPQQPTPTQIALNHGKEVQLQGAIVPQASLNLAGQQQPQPITQTPVQQPTVATPDADTDDDEDDKKPGGRGRPKKGFTLCIGCAPIKGQTKKGSGRFTYHLADLLKEIHGAAVVGWNQNPANANNQITSAYAIDNFKRWDTIRQFVPQIVDTFGADVVAATGVGNGQSDLRVLLDALRPFAAYEISAVSE